MAVDPFPPLTAVDLLPHLNPAARLFPLPAGAVGEDDDDDDDDGGKKLR